MNGQVVGFTQVLHGAPMEFVRRRKGNLMTQPGRSDPIRGKYFNPIEMAEKWSSGIFALSALLSIAAAVVPEAPNPKVFISLQVSFLISVIVLFVLDQTTRLYLSPRGADARALDFFSRAYRQTLSHERTNEYYNSATASPVESIAAQTFENSLFTKEIANRMFRAAIPITGLYLVLWFGAVIYRDTPLTLLATCAQVVFGEQIIAKLLRLMWLKARSEQVFNDLTNIFAAGVQNPTFAARTMLTYTKYESAKAVAGITLSSKIFEDVNPRLSLTWGQLKRTHNIQ
jgi:hypothetical protein